MNKFFTQVSTIKGVFYALSPFIPALGVAAGAVDAIETAMTATSIAVAAAGLHDVVRNEDKEQANG